METFSAPKPLVKNPNYSKERQRILSKLQDDMIDSQIIEVINGLNQIPFLKDWGLYFSDWLDMLFCVGIIEELIEWDWGEDLEE